MFVVFALGLIVATVYHTVLLPSIPYRHDTSWPAAVSTTLYKIHVFTLILAVVYYNVPLPYPYDTSWPAGVSTTFSEIYSRADLSEHATAIISSDDSFERVRCDGCESIDFKGEDEIVTIDKVGNLVVRLKSSLDVVTKEVYVGQGRPLGFEHDESSNTVVICNSLIGLMEYNYDSRDLRVLDSVALYVNDVSVDPRKPSRVFYSSSSSKGRVVWNSQKQFYDTMRTFLLVWWR